MSAVLDGGLGETTAKSTNDPTVETTTPVSGSGDLTSGAGRGSKEETEDTGEASKAGPEVKRASSAPVRVSSLSAKEQLLVASPARRRPKPPTKGILKPPPPPAKPTLGGRLRDLASTVVGTGSRLFEQDDITGGQAGAASSTGSSSSSSTQGAAGGSAALPRGLGMLGQGQAGPSAQSISNAVGGTLNSLSGRLRMGLSGFVAASTSAPGSSTGSSTNGSPLPQRIGLPDVTGTPAGSTQNPPLMSERSRQKQPLKKATFMLPTLSITYPISTQAEPWSAKVTEERRKIEVSHRDRLCHSTGAEYWTADRLMDLYENACRTREETKKMGILRALEEIPPPPRHRHIHLLYRPFDPSSASAQPPTASHILHEALNRHSAEAFADVLSSEWGLADLRLEGGIIESEEALKPILHALLVSGTLSSLSLAGNKRIRAGGWAIVAVFLKKARLLRFVDLSDTNWDKRSMEYLVRALTCSAVRPSAAGSDTSPTSTSHPDRMPDQEVDDIPDKASSDATQPEAEDGDEEADMPPSGYGSFVPPAPLLRDHEETSLPTAVQTLRMDGCSLRNAALELLGQGVRSSDVKHISLRRNRIGPLGGVALALMIRDYPDANISLASLTPSLSTITTAAPPSVNGSTTEQSSGYAAYVSRTRRPAAPQNSACEDAELPPIPLVVSSAAGGITSRTVPDGYTPPPLPPKEGPTQLPTSSGGIFDLNGVSSISAEGRFSSEPGGGASMALQRSVRALDGIERIGRLVTLDLKSNEIKNGVTYIAQVLKRNRTLKVLNVSDNRIEPAGLAALAEALKYNSTLETLDVSSNPCGGPAMDGIAALRTTFTVNTSLKRLFLSETGITSEGAIALAEFLPETKSLLHLDLTLNPLDTAGILAISSGLKSNTLIRCLDVSIPPNNPDLAELSQSILQSCIRNTELAAAAVVAATPTKAASGGGGAGGQEAIWAPIKRSTLVRNVKDAEELRAEQERLSLMQSPEGLAREYVYTLKPEKLITVTRNVADSLQRWYDAGDIARKPGFRAWEPGQLPREEFRPLMERAKVLKERIVERAGEVTDEEEMLDLITLNESLSTLIDRAKGFTPPPRLLLPSQIVPAGQERAAHSPIRPMHPSQQNRHTPRRHLRNASLEISSPNFSIGDSDGESDAEELDVHRFESSGSSSSRSRLPNGLKMPAPPNGYIKRSSTLDRSTTPSTALFDADEEDGGAVLSTPSRSRTRSSPTEGNLFGVAEPPSSPPVTSPVEKVSRAWVEEEGEIFRKGTRLGVADEEEMEENADVTGEELKQEILETEVARSPTRRVIPVDADETQEAEKVEQEA